MRRSGFTLVELMLIIAILAVLASLATPFYMDMVYKSRRAEAHTVLDGVGTAESAYFTAHDVWVSGSSNPGGSLTKSSRPWNSSMSGWSTLGYSPDGEVRCSYIATQYGGNTWVRADAYCDVDDNNQSYILRYYVPSSSSAQTTFGWREVDPTRY